MIETLQINKIANGWLVAYPEPTKTLHPNQRGFDQQAQGQGQPKMCAHYCADLAEVGAYLLTLEH